jgi:UDP-N-acetylmuramate dehydrogenase
MIVKEQFDLTEYNSYRIKAVCLRAYFPECEEDLVEIFSTDEKKIIIGGGFNIILSKEYYHEAFVIFDKHFSKVTIDGNIITGQAGISMYELSVLALEHSLSGIEIFYDIPSSLGGAVVMNAGAGGWEIKDILKYVRYFDPHALTFHEKQEEEIGFEYRNSFFQMNPHYIITEVTLRLELGSKEEIEAKMIATRETRCAKQPKEFPNAGSVFKRPKGYYVGAIMDELGLKGLSIGGAKVSEKHGGFIINHNKATGQDIIAVITEVKKRVYEAFKLDLEIEQRII